MRSTFIRFPLCDPTHAHTSFFSVKISLANLFIICVNSLSYWVKKNVGQYIFLLLQNEEHELQWH